MKPLSICAIVRDEAPYIAEWIAFHRTVGVSRFFIYDDRSTDNTIDICRTMSDGDVVIHPYEEGWHSPKYSGVKGRHRWRAVVNAFRTKTFGSALPKGVRRTVTPQSCAYRHCDAHHKDDTFWCAFIDIDEYLFHDQIDCLPKFLEPYEEFSGVAANWLVFGSNRHQIRPDGLTIENYTRRKALDNLHRNPCCHTKHIVRMNAAHFWGRFIPHSPNYEVGRGITQQFIPVTNGLTEHPTDSGLRLHHYCHRSYAEVAAKIATRTAWSIHSPLYRMHEYDCNEIVDESALHLAHRVRADLQRHGLQPYNRSNEDTCNLINVIKKRRSVRAFDTSKNVDDAIIKSILEAGSYAPSAGNLQPWKFHVVRDPETKHKLAWAAAHQTFITQAPVVIVISIDTAIASSRYRNRSELYAIQSTAAAAQNMLLAIQYFGLVGCWVGAFRENRVSAIVNLPENLRPVVIVPFGYPIGQIPHHGRKPLGAVVEGLEIK